MVNVSIDVTDLGGEARPGDKVVFWRPRMGGSAKHAGRVISTAPVTVFLTDGKATVSDVEPGEMTVLLQCRGVESQGPVTVGVPDGNGTVTLRALLESQFEYAPPIVSAVQEAASNASASEEAAIQAQIRSEAAADRADAKVDDAINNGANLVRDEVKQDADRAVSAVQEATQAEDNAKTSENAAASSASNAKASETNAKQSETNAGDYAAVATTAATEAVSSIGDSVSAAAGHADRAEQYESGAAAYAQNASDAADRVGTAEQVGTWAQQAQSAVDSVTGQVQLVEDAVGTVTEKSQQVESAAEQVTEWAAPKEWSESYTQVIQAESFGAVGNNSTDDSDALQSAINQSAETGLPLVLRNKTYRISKTLNVPSGARIYGNGSARIWAIYGVDIAFSIEGTAEDPVPLVRTSTSGSKRAEVQDASKFSSGDLVRIVSQRVATSADAGDEWSLGPSTAADWPVYFGEFVRVADVTTSTNVNFESPLIFPDYRPDNAQESHPLARDSASLQKINAARNITFSGFSVGGYPGIVFSVEFGDNVRIEEVDWETARAGGHFVEFRGSFNCEVRQCRAVYLGTEYNGRSAGKNPYKFVSSQNCGAVDCYAERPTQGFDITFNNVHSTPSIGCYVVDCDVQTPLVHGATSHGGTIFSTFRGNRIYNALASGILNRGMAGLVEGNMLIGDSSNGNFGISMQTTGARDSLIANNQIHGFNTAVLVAEDDGSSGLDRPIKWSGVRIVGNIARHYRRSAVEIRRYVSKYLEPAGIYIQNNSFRSKSTYGIEIGQYASWVEITDTVIDQFGSGSASIYAHPNVTSLTVSGCTITNTLGDAVRMHARTDSAVAHPTLYIGQGNTIRNATYGSYSMPADGSVKFTKQPLATVTGSRSGGAALASLISALTKAGFIEDQTTT